jgi:hypothetical protein
VRYLAADDWLTVTRTQTVGAGREPYIAARTEAEKTTPPNGDAAPPAWLTAVAERGYAYLVFTTRPWPEGRPGLPIEAEALTSFVGAEQTLRAAAHVVLPAQGPHA